MNAKSKAGSVTVYMLQKCKHTWVNDRLVTIIEANEQSNIYRVIDIEDGKTFIVGKKNLFEVK